MRAKKKLIDVQEKEKEELLRKLKDMGNSFLGNFGLNTDMFKFQQNADGGYSFQYEKEP